MELELFGMFVKPHDQYLLKYRYDDSTQDSLWIRAAKNNDVQRLKYLLKTGNNVNETHTTNENKHTTAFLIATKTKNIEMAKCLVKNNGEYNQVGDGLTPLMQL